MELMHTRLDPSNYVKEESFGDIDIGTIEQIANGIEKMVGSWTLSQGGKPQIYNNNSLDQVDCSEQYDDEFDEEENNGISSDQEAFGEAEITEDQAMEYYNQSDTDTDFNAKSEAQGINYSDEKDFNFTEMDMVDEDVEGQEGAEELGVIDPLDFPSIPGKEFPTRINSPRGNDDEAPDAIDDMENFKFQLDENITLDDTNLFSANDVDQHSDQTGSSSESGIYEQDLTNPDDSHKFEENRCEEVVCEPETWVRVSERSADITEVLCEPEKWGRVSERSEDIMEVLCEPEKWGGISHRSEEITAHQFKAGSWVADHPEDSRSSSVSSSYVHEVVHHPTEEIVKMGEERNHKKFASNPAKADAGLHRNDSDPIRKVMGWKESALKSGNPPNKHVVPKHKLGQRKKHMEAAKKDLKKPILNMKSSPRKNDSKPDDDDDDKFEWSSEFKHSLLSSSDMLYTGDGSHNDEMEKQCLPSHTVSLNQELAQLRIDHPTGDEELKMDLLAQMKEYEAKLLEMKMKTLQLHSQFQNNGSCAFLKADKPRETELPLLPNNTERPEDRKLEICKKQIMKLQKEKETLTKEIYDLKHKERQFEMQRQKLEETQHTANLLQRELIKKEEDLVEWQLREKKADAELHQAELALRRIQGTYLEPEKILNLVPALCAWLQSLKKIGPVRCEHRQLLQVQHFEASLLKILDECIPMDELQVSLTNSPAVADIQSLSPYRANQAISIYDR